MVMASYVRNYICMELPQGIPDSHTMAPYLQCFFLHIKIHVSDFCEQLELDDLTFMEQETPHHPCMWKDHITKIRVSDYNT